MPAEQSTNQYIEQAKLNDIGEQVKQMAEHPDQFGPDQLQKDYEQRLADVVGKRQLNDSEFRQYQEALAKIKENVQQLREMQDYFHKRTVLSTVEDYVSKNGLEKSAEFDTRWVIYSTDLKKVQGLLDMEKRPELLPSETFFEDAVHAKKVRDGLIDLMKKEFSQGVEKIGSNELNTVSNVIGEIVHRESDKMVTLNDYEGLEFAADTLVDLLKDQAQVFPAAVRDTSMDLLVEQGRSRLRDMRTVLLEAQNYMLPADIEVVRNMMNAERALARGDQGAREWYNAAAVRKDLRVSRQEAAVAQREAYWVKTDAPKYQEAANAFSQADRVAKADYAQAAELYRRARDLYRDASGADVA